MYLLDCVPLKTKHTLVFYALCDLYALVPEETQQEVGIFQYVCIFIPNSFSLVKVSLRFYLCSSAAFDIFPSKICKT